ncbi:MAG: epoxyqueuosine reductase QueH [Clostridia bacterium]|nr:epoxyqueuosine reductase QueH [Clostridia bacterium]
MKEKLSGLKTAYGERNNEVISDISVTEKKEKRTVFLHSCCGPCSTACIERLLPDYHVVVFYYNPNITDRDEYEKRKESQIRFITEYNRGLNEEDQVKFIEGEYIPEDYFSFVSGLEKEKEGGKRCTECFRLRLDRTAKAAKELGYSIFTTTLTVSPHKNSPLIMMIGEETAERYGLTFLDMDFKKKDGFKKSIELAKKYELYRQNYCGCEFSKWFLDK